MSMKSFPVDLLAQQNRGSPHTEHTAKAIFGDLRLFPFKPIVKRDDGAGATVIGLNCVCGVGWYYHVLIIVPSLDFELLIMV